MSLTFSVPDTELSATLHNRRPQLVDQIFKGTAFLNMMRQLGAIETIDGGLEIVQPVRFAKNTTVGSFDGYDILDTTPQDNETSVRVPWSADYATIAISWTENQKNQGRGRLLNLLQMKIDDAGDAIRDLLNIQLLAQPSASGSKDPFSILEAVQIDPTTNPNRLGAIGNIQDTNTWWRNKSTNGGAFATADMNQMFNDVSDGHDFPNFLLTAQAVYQYYENSQVGQLRYSDTRVADAGFQSLMFKQTPIIWEPVISQADAMFFINTKYFKIALMQGADFVTTDFIEPDNQAAKVAKILWMGNLYVTSRRRLGVLNTITAPA